VRAQKQRCENCPARSKRVVEIIVQRTKRRMTLCPPCRKIVDKLERELQEAAK
jgi:hypothetical protein